MLFKGQIPPLHSCGMAGDTSLHLRRMDKSICSCVTWIYNVAMVSFATNDNLDGKGDNIQWIWN